MGHPSSRPQTCRRPVSFYALWIELLSSQPVVKDNLMRNNADFSSFRMNRFSYLERHGDIQMLALLSCVFKDPFRNTIAVTGITPVS